MNKPAHQPHADAELTLSAKVAPPPPGAGPTREEKNAALAASAAAMRERNAAAAGDGGEIWNADAVLAAAAAEAKPRENVESIEVELTDGRKVVFGPPAGVSLTMRMATMFPQTAVNPVLERVARVLMCIRSVDDRLPKPISNQIEMTAFANAMGDRAIDELGYWYDQNWGVIQIADLRLVKKNLRE